MISWGVGVEGHRWSLRASDWAVTHSMHAICYNSNLASSFAHPGLRRRSTTLEMQLPDECATRDASSAPAL